MTAPPLHGGQLRHLAARFNVPASQLLDLSANLNPEGPPASLVNALRKSLEDAATLTAYPDLEEHLLRQAIAQFVGTSADCVSVANGFVPLLEAACRATNLNRCLLPVPAFVEYRRMLERLKVQIVPHALVLADDFSYAPERLLDGVHDAILLANPQNPTGILATQSTLVELTQAAAMRKITVLLDEAFIDYAPEHSLAPEAERHPNLIVFRSVTKFLGVPGLRVAYAIANPRLTSAIQAQLPPWPISTIASRAISAGLMDVPFALRTRELNQRRSRGLANALCQLGIKTYPTPANFLLLKLPPLIDATELWLRLITEHGIVLRNCANYEALPSNHLRTAIRTDAENTSLIGALRDIYGNACSST